MKGLVPCWYVHDVMGFSVTMFVERVVCRLCPLVLHSGTPPLKCQLSVEGKKWSF